MKVLQLNKVRRSQVVSKGASKGQNNRDFEQLLSPQVAQLISNFEVLADGRIARTKGYKTFEDYGSQPLSEYSDWTEYFTVYAQGSTVKVLDKRNNTTTIVKDNYTNQEINGLAYSDYFFIGSPQDQLRRIEQRVYFSNLTGTITAGDSIINSSINKIGEVLEVKSNYFVLGDTKNIAPQDGEQITVGTEQCTVSSYEIHAASISNAPSPTCMNLIGSRLYIGSKSRLWFSDVDIAGENPPYDSWKLASSVPDEGSTMSFEKAGYIRAILPFSNFFIVYQDNGKFGARHQTTDSNGTLKRIDIPQFERVDTGGSRAALSTSYGHFYFSESGLWNLRNILQDNTPFPEQDVKLSQLLGPEYFKDIDIKNSRPHMMYDSATNTIYITFAKGSQINNKILAYNIDKKSFTELEGWPINKFYSKGNEFYGLSSINGRVYKLFDGYTLDGLKMTSKYRQEIQIGGLNTIKDILGITVQSKLSYNSKPNILIKNYNQHGVLSEKVVRFEISQKSHEKEIKGYNELGFGEGFGCTFETLGESVDKTDQNMRIRNVHRMILEIQETGDQPFEINHITIEAIEKPQQRKRQLTRIR